MFITRLYNIDVEKTSSLFFSSQMKSGYSVDWRHLHAYKRIRPTFELFAQEHHHNFLLSPLSQSSP